MEGGKISISIAQVKETQRLTFRKLAQWDDDEILRTIHRYRE